MSLVLRRTRLVLDMIKFEHTIFALPFAMISMLLASHTLHRTAPGIGTVLWILLAMVGARSAAMTFNRLADHELDSHNPRTAKRHLPAGAISRTHAWIFLGVAIAVFELAAFSLNRLCFALSPVALAAVLGYSYTKRFTSLCHLFLGFAIGIAPIGAWMAVRGDLSPVSLLLGLAVLLWIGGFDIIYALQDYDYDCSTSLFSLPKRLGKSKALTISRVMHTVLIGVLLAAGVLAHLHIIAAVGLVVVTGLIVYEQALVKPDDLSRVDLAFFTLNGWVSMTLFLFVLVDCLCYR
jgi:4-hydroxybenzoate polyprenyltransferase